LYRLVYELEYLQGIGAGAGVKSSGESVVADLVTTEAPVVFDVGANEGQFTEMIDAKLPNASVHLFEPQASLLPTLEKKYDDDPTKLSAGTRSPTRMQRQRFITTNRDHRLHQCRNATWTTSI
jgi:hypothetical protein